MTGGLINVFCTELKSPSTNSVIFLMEKQNPALAILINMHMQNNLIIKLLLNLKLKSRPEKHHHLCVIVTKKTPSGFKNKIKSTYSYFCNYSDSVFIFPLSRYQPVHINTPESESWLFIHLEWTKIKNKFKK